MCDHNITIDKAGKSKHSKTLLLYGIQVVATRVCGNNLNIVSMCAVSPVVHTSNISSCQKNFFSFPVAVNNSIKVGPLVFLL